MCSIDVMGRLLPRSEATQNISPVPEVKKGLRGLGLELVLFICSRLQRFPCVSELILFI